MTFFDNLKETLDTVSKDVVCKVNTTTAITKLNGQIKKNQQMSDQVKMKLGAAVYEKWDQSMNSQFAEFLKVLKELDEENQKYKNEIVRIQEEEQRRQAEKEQQSHEETHIQEEAVNTPTFFDGKTCPSCGQANDMDAKFCVHCGISFTEIED